MTEKRSPTMRSTSYNRIHSTPEVKALAYRPSRFFGPRIQMPFFLVVEILVAIIHHLYYTHLNNKEVTEGRGNILRQQGIANAIGNSLAYVVIDSSTPFLGQQSRLLSSSNSGVPCARTRAGADVALFCTARLVHCVRSVRHLLPRDVYDAHHRLDSGGTPREVCELHKQEECVVNTVNLPNGSAVGPFVAEWYQRRTILQGSYIPPSASCGDKSCRYQVSFSAPAFNCTNITSKYDFTLFRSNPLNDTDLFYIYNGTAGNNGTAVQVASFNTSIGQLEAIQCEAYSASYELTVTQSNLTTPTINIDTMKLIAPVPDDVMALYSSNATGIMRLTNSAVDLFEGEIYASKDSASIGAMQVPGMLPTPIMNSPLLFFSHTEVRWTMDMMDAVPSIMQNISLSLLSNEVQQASALGVTFLNNISTQCSFSADFYQYQRTRLLVTYGGATIITAGCIAVGLWAIRRNGGTEETMEFSRMVDALVNARMYEAREQFGFSKDTRLRSDSSNDGRLRPS